MTFSCVEVPVKFCNSNRTPAKDGMTTFTFVANCQVITISLHARRKKTAEPDAYERYVRVRRFLIATPQTRAFQPLA